MLPESRAELGHRRFDIPGALSVTAGLSLLVYAVVTTDTHPWGSARTIGLLVAAAALLAGFVIIEHRSAAPLLPLSFFANRTVSVADAIFALLGTSIFAMFFFLSLYMQNVLGYSALRAGLAFLPMAIAVIIGAQFASRLMTRVGVRALLLLGTALATGGFWYLRNALLTGNPFYPVAGAGLPGLFDRAAMRGGEGDVVHSNERNPLLPRCESRDLGRREHAQRDPVVREWIVEGEQQFRFRAALGELRQFPEAAPAWAGLLLQEQPALIDDPGAVLGQGHSFTATSRQFEPAVPDLGRNANLHRPRSVFGAFPALGRTVGNRDRFE